MSGVTLPFDCFEDSCFAGWDGVLVGACLFGDLLTVAVKTKKSTAASSPPPRRMSLPLLIPFAVLTDLVANTVATASSPRFGPLDSDG
jgi:hypothetical protein